MNERRAKLGRQRKDFLHIVTEEMKKDCSLLTVSKSAFCALIYFFSDFAIYQKEHETILRNCEKRKKSGITWSEYRSMDFTNEVKSYNISNN